MNRKQRRAQNAQIKKDANSELATKAAMFGKMPDECTACEAPFDKTDKEMVTTWRVVVREQDEEMPVRIYCSVCWDTVNEVISNFLKAKESENDI